MDRTYYILKGKQVVPTNSVQEWAEWFENAKEKRIVKQEEVNGKKVSTVFLGLNHQYGDDENSPPLLFETMIFSPDEEYCERCSTWEEAEVMHRNAVLVAMEEENNDLQNNRGDTTEV